MPARPVGLNNRGQFVRAANAPRVRVDDRQHADPAEQHPRSEGRRDLWWVDEARDRIKRLDGTPDAPPSRETPVRAPRP